jgi:preprotein translocase subunit SecD
MFYLKRFIFTIIFLFLFVSYAAQNTTNSAPHPVNDKQQLIFQVVGDKLILNKADIEKIQFIPQDGEQPQAIEIQFTDDAAKKVEAFSVRNSGQHMQIIWNSIILSDAVIQSSLPPVNGTQAGMPEIDSSVPPMKGMVVMMSDVDSSVVQDMVSNL